MRSAILFTLILILGSLLRLFHLETVPPALYGDEQAFAWNGYNILLTGEDEYGNPYPLQFRSFDDYKAPIPVYLLVPFIKMFGLNPFAIRFPIAIASIITILVTYLLSLLFFRKKISLIVSFLIAVSPWHIHLSRGFFEATLSLLFFILGIYYFLKGKAGLKRLLLSTIFFAASLYSYFTPRILIPFFLPFLYIYGIKYHHKAYKNKKQKDNFKHLLRNYFVSLFVLVIISLPLLKLTFLDKGFSRLGKLAGERNLVISQTVNRERFSSTLSPFWKVIFHNKATVLLRLIKNDYLENLSPNFWYIYGDNSLRYFTGNMGMFYLAEFPFFILGLYLLWMEKRKAAVLFIGWILLAPIPASLVGRSFAVRSLALLPAPFMIVGYGIYRSVLLLQHNISKWFKYLLPIIYGFVLMTLLIRYYLEYPVYAATWWGWENKAAIDYARKKESKYDNIFISNFYSGATLAFAVYTKYDPIKYRNAVNNPIILADGREMVKLGKYYFGSLDLDEKRLKTKIIPEKSLYIGRPEEPSGEDRITAPVDGRLLFVVHDTFQKECYVNNQPRC